MSIENRLIVALDLPERERIVDFAKRLGPEVGMVKIGLEAFIAHGPDLVREIVDAGAKVFLDLKVHDIPRTAAAAVRQASTLGASLLTIHRAGGAEMIRASKVEAHNGLEILAVTVLTSFDEDGLAALGYREGVSGTVRRLAELSLENGADGLVCSSHELELLGDLGGHRVVPGIRPAGAAHGDQKRVATPSEAVKRGASWIVVGRPIVQSDDPVAASRAIVAELDTLS